MCIKTPHLHPSHRRWEPFLLTSTQSWVQWFGLERHHSKQLAQSPGDFSVLVRWNLPLIFQEFQGGRVSKKLPSYFAFFPPPDIRDQLVLLQFSSNALFNSLPFFWSLPKEPRATATLLSLGLTNWPGCEPGLADSVIGKWSITFFISVWEEQELHSQTSDSWIFQEKPER